MDLITNASAPEDTRDLVSEMTDLRSRDLKSRLFSE